MTFKIVLNFLEAGRSDKPFQNRRLLSLQYLELACRLAFPWLIVADRPTSTREMFHTVNRLTWIGQLMVPIHD